MRQKQLKPQKQAQENGVDIFAPFNPEKVVTPDNDLTNTEKVVTTDNDLVPAENGVAIQSDKSEQDGPNLSDNST